MTLLKSLVGFLALANLGYFLWTRGVAHPLEAGPAAPATTLKLVSEVPASQRGAPSPAADEDPGIPSGAAGMRASIDLSGSKGSCGELKFTKRKKRSLA